MSEKKKVFVSGCFDMLHSGHVAFLNEAANYGDVYVGIGSDRTIFDLKGRHTINTEGERKYMLEALKCVKRCIINSGKGLLDFEKELKIISPDYLFVNEDGNTSEKKELCREFGIEYIISKRIPHENFPRRSTSDLRTTCHIPYRIDIAGGWLDQPFVSELFPGPVITISIEPTVEFNERSGMASSTRRRAVELWQSNIPEGDREKLAKILFSYDNSPGVKNISGSQDALGIVMPGLNKLDYKKDYWPLKIHSIYDESVLKFLENSMYLLTIGPRDDKFEVLDKQNLSVENAKNLALAADNCWQAIIKKDIKNFGKYFKESFEAQAALFPGMINDRVSKLIELYKDQAYGWKLSGAGGGGYLILISDKNIEGAMKINIRRGNL
ncbi:adenylyltransferase/cytidyltransferase family protein [Bacteroidota bacterium]